MTTGEEIIAGARSVLQDKVEPYRYEDADLLSYLNAAIREMWRVRPDLFAGQLRSTIPSFTSGSLSEDVPFPEAYVTPVEMYIAGYAELRDDEFTTDGRAIALLARFTSQLKQAV